MRIQCPKTEAKGVQLDPINRKIGDIECIYILDFFKRLWREGI